MKTVSAFLVAILSLQTFVPLATARSHAFTTSPQPYIQIALLLDTSNSMDGLIAQAKSQLWNIVKELSNTKCQNTNAKLEIALYQYGNDGLPSRNGWLQQVSPFTTDLDRISEALFNLKTNGGSEHSPQVIVQACDNLGWRAGTDILRLLFIAGNEEFQQGPVTIDQACAAALSKRVTVTTIHCGDQQTGMSMGWSRLPSCTEGKYLFIDGDYKERYVVTPYDSKILQLNTELNKTYIAYGADGRRGLANQTLQDANASGFASSNMTERAVAKGSVAYNNSNWDFIDAVKEKRVDLNSDSKDMPEEFRKLKPAERQQKFDQKKNEREKIQKQIAGEEVKRQAFIREQQKKDVKSSGLSLQSRVISSIHELASKKGFVIAK